MHMEIYCCGCAKIIDAELTNGAAIYPHRSDLSCIPFWRCRVCGNYVGCHHKTENKTQPLGVIPTKAIRNARKHIHALLDNMWSNSKQRKHLYAELSEQLGWKYHTANIRSIEEARKVYKILKKMSRSTE